MSERLNKQWLWLLGVLLIESFNRESAEAEREC